MNTVNFINTVGFDANGSALMVQFGYNATNATTGASYYNVVEVPMLTIVPIPYLQVRSALPLWYITCKTC